MSPRSRCCPESTRDTPTRRFATPTRRAPPPRGRWIARRTVTKRQRVVSSPVDWQRDEGKPLQTGTRTTCGRGHPVSGGNHPPAGSTRRDWMFILVTRGVREHFVPLVTLSRTPRKERGLR